MQQLVQLAKLCSARAGGNTFNEALPLLTSASLIEVS